MNGYLRHLANFVHIVETGSITGTANRLGISASAMSESVKILEAYFREPLLERRKSGVVPTSRGAAVYEDSRPIVSALDRVMQAEEPGFAGMVKVSAPTELLNNVYGPAVLHIQKEAPELDLILAAENEVLDYSKFSRDLYIRVGKSTSHKDLNTLYQFAGHVVMVARPEALRGIDIADPQAVQALTFIGGLRSEKAATVKLIAPDVVMRFERTLQVGSIDGRLAMMRAGAGVVCCLNQSVEADLKSGRLVRLFPDRFKVDTQLVIGSPHKNPAPSVKLVADAFAAVHSV